MIALLMVLALTVVLSQYAVTAQEATYVDYDLLTASP